MRCGRADLPGRQRRRPSRAAPPDWCDGAGTYLATHDGRAALRDRVEYAGGRRWETRGVDLPIRRRKHYLELSDEALVQAIHLELPLERVDTVKYVRLGFKVRCHRCGKRLRPKPQYCIGGERTGWTLPAHKTK